MDEKFQIKFVTKLSDWMIENEVGTLTEFCERAQIDVNSIRLYRKGVRYPQMSVFERLSEVLDTHPAWFFGYEDGDESWDDIRPLSTFVNSRIREEMDFWRAKNRVTKKDMYERLGYSRETVANWVYDRCGVSLSTLVDVASLFEIPVYDFFLKRKW